MTDAIYILDNRCGVVEFNTVDGENAIVLIRRLERKRCEHRECQHLQFTCIGGDYAAIVNPNPERSIDRMTITYPDYNYTFSNCEIVSVESHIVTTSTGNCEEPVVGFLVATKDIELELRR